MTRKRRPPIPAPIPSPLGEQLRYARESRGHTQEDAGFQIGIRQNVYSSWESRGRRPRLLSPDTLEAIRDYLIVSDGEPWTLEKVRDLFPRPPLQGGGEAEATPPGREVCPG